MGCGTWFYHHPETGSILRYFCSRKNCTNDICRKKYAGSLRRRFYSMVMENRLDYFFTLTLDPGPGNCMKEVWERHYGDSEHYIKYLWNCLATSLRQRYPCVGKNGPQIPIQFVWVIERQGNGNAHLHGFWNKRVDVVWLRRVWKSYGGGAQIELKHLRDRGCKGVSKRKLCSYLTKYVSKSVTGRARDDNGKHIPIEGRIWGRSVGLRAIEETIPTGYRLQRDDLYMADGETDLTCARNMIPSNHISDRVRDTLHKRIRRIEPDGEAKRFWEDLEGTQRAAPEESTSASIAHMEAEEEARYGSPKARYLTEEKRRRKQGDSALARYLKTVSKERRLMYYTEKQLKDMKLWPNVKEA